LTEVYIGVGTNIGNRRDNILEAMHRISEGITIKSCSSVYETEPEGIKEQPEFLNCVIGAEVYDGPRELLRYLQDIERAMGRSVCSSGAPRIIDLDILLYGDQVINEQSLTIPHPSMANRRFVLVPLDEIAPNLKHPVLNKRITELLGELQSESRVVRFCAMADLLK
jgi:2-amino-4-hydroxy-6-hydroxymethyldihydropteridine diphosphokinase